MAQTPIPAGHPADLHPQAADDAPLTLALWYQPKIDLRKRCLCGAEGVLRFRDADGRDLSADDVLPDLHPDDVAAVAEQALYVAFDDWATFKAAGFDLRLAIPLPPVALGRVPIAEIVARHRLADPEWPGLVLQVAEEEIVRDIARASALAAALRPSAVDLSIDDFGAGYSSFASLRDLAFVEVKLHRSFVENCAVDATNAAICQTAIDLAHRFGAVTVAKDIAALADLQALQIMGCDIGQGVLLSPAMPVDDYIALLESRLNRPKSVAPLGSVTPSGSDRVSAAG